MIIDLDAPAGRDPARVGAKAASLAAARAAGAAVLPGFVVEGAVSRSHLDLGARTLPSRGSGGARLAIVGEEIDRVEAIVAAGRRLGDRLVARSSTLLESSGEWSGAFTSYVDIAPSELPKALTGCWASAFSVTALDRQQVAGVTPGSFAMSVLVQPALEPDAGGWAEIAPDGTVSVHGIKGSPAPLLQGWEAGAVARFHDGWSGDQLIELVGVEHLEAIRAMLGTVEAGIGANRCEWALTDRVWALQVGRNRAPRGDATGLDIPADVPGELVEIARTVVQAPGTLGEEMVLPWALGGMSAVDVASTGGGPGTVDRARQLCLELTEEVWGRIWAHAKPAADRAMSDLLGGNLDTVVPELRRLRAPDPVKTSRLLAILRSLQDELVDRGVVAEARDAWHLDLASIEQALDGGSVPKSARLGIGRWEPFVASVVLGASDTVQGAAASPGIGAGLRADILDPSRGRPPDRRAVITTVRPVPNVASLLWDAAGLITATGSPAAHLFEAARALRLPAVCGVDLGARRNEILAVDGHTGTVGRIDLDRPI